jgi:tetratricopeptide (TPR) repeat protein
VGATGFDGVGATGFDGAEAAADGGTGAVVWPARLAKVRIMRMSKGTGWAIGATGVLTARRVIEPLLATDADPQAPRGPIPRSAEIVIGASPERSFDGEVIWQSAASGLAILNVSRNTATWQTLLRSAPEPALAYPPPEPVQQAQVVGLPGRPGGSETSTVAWMLAAPELAPGVLHPGDTRGAPSAFAVDRRDLPRAARRHGMPGAVVLGTEPRPTVLGIVIDGPKNRRSPRFEIATLPDPAIDAAFAAALTQVGCPAVVINMHGPTLQRYLRGDSLDEALRPRRVADVSDRAFFGTKPARTDISQPAEPYFAWVSRPERQSLSTAIDRALAGHGPRFIVLRGPSAAGKSRLAAEVVRTHPGLRNHALLAPLATASILDLPRPLLPERSVIYIDGVGDLPVTALSHERVRTLLDERPETLFVATLLDLPEASGSARLVDNGAWRRGADDPEEQPGADFPLASTSLSGVHAVIDDDVLAVAIGVSATPVWARAGGSSNRSDWALARAKKQGLGLGEYLSGYHDLADHYTAATWPTRALVDLVADWHRSGIGEPLPLSTARMLWDRLLPTQLPRDELRLFSRLSAAEREGRWRGALEYACDIVLGCASLVRQTPAGLVAGEFSRVHIDQGAISTQLWEYLLNEHPTTPLQRVDLGVRALGSGTAQRALRAFESVLFFRDNDVLDAANRAIIEVIARRGIALHHARTGRDEQAIMVYTDLVDTFGESSDPDVCEQVAQALLGIGLTFAKLGSLGQAVSAYTELADRFRDHPSPLLGEYVAKALLGQATTLAALGRHDEEHAAYADIIARCSADESATVAAIVDLARAATRQAPPATS